jgi:5-enolpyruvylshikimate-3-phosphate synthase
MASRSPVAVHEAEIVEESFPEFVSVLEKLGAVVMRGD